MRILYLTAFQRLRNTLCTQIGCCYLPPSLSPSQSSGTSPSQTAERSSQPVVAQSHGSGLSWEPRPSRAAWSLLIWLGPGLQLICQWRNTRVIMESSNGTCYKVPIDFMRANQQKPPYTYTREINWDTKLISAVLASGVLLRLFCEVWVCMDLFSIKFTGTEPSFSQTAELGFVAGVSKKQMKAQRFVWLPPASRNWSTSAEKFATVSSSHSWPGHPAGVRMAPCLTAEDPPSSQVCSGLGKSL